MLEGSYIFLADTEIVDQAGVATIMPTGTAITCVPRAGLELDLAPDVLCLAMYESHVLGRTDVHDNRIFSIYQRHISYLIPTTKSWVSVVIGMLKNVRYTATLDSFTFVDGKPKFTGRTEIKDAVITKMTRDQTQKFRETPRIKLVFEGPSGTQVLKLSHPHHLLKAHRRE